jgi:hypothetical protein
LADLESTGPVAKDIFKFNDRRGRINLEAMALNALIEVVDRPQVDAMPAVLDRLIVAKTGSVLDGQAAAASGGWDGHGHYQGS